jgi:RNA polymerase sigma-70 factor (ECF subfamily)
MNRLEEQRLIRSARRGDGDAMAALIRHHQQSLYAFLLRRCGRPDLAEDLVQEAFVRVMRNLDRFDPTFRFSTWLFTIARRLLVNHLQKMRPAFDSDLVAAMGGDGVPDPIVEAEQRRHLRGILDAALGTLNPQQRQIVALFHEHAQPIPEIARSLGIPEGTVKSHLHRARRRMQESIAADAVAHQRALELLGLDRSMEAAP